MLEFPSSDWQEHPVEIGQALHSLGEKLPAITKWRIQSQPVRHIFTHFELLLTVATARAGPRKPAGLWLKPEQAQKRALPGLMNKVLKAALRDI